MPRKLYLLFSFFLVATGFYYLANWPITATDTDLWYHLNGGRYFFENGSVAKTSFFSFIEPQRPWVNYYWLFQALIYQMFSWWGYVGLIYFRTLLACATLLMLLLYLYRDQRKGDALAYYTLLFVFYVLLFLPRSLPVRPHLFSYLFIVIFLYILEFKASNTDFHSKVRPDLGPGTVRPEEDESGDRGCPAKTGSRARAAGGERRSTPAAGGYPEGIRSDSGASRSGASCKDMKANWYKVCWLLPPLGALWSNLHGIEYPVMLLVLGAYFAEFVYEQVKKADPPRKDTYLYPGLLALSAFAVLCTPHGIGLLAVPFKSIAQVSPFIYELRPLSIYDFASFFGILFFLAGLVAFTALRKKRMRISHLLLFLGGLALLLKGKRLVNEYVLLALPLLKAYMPAVPAGRRARVLMPIATVLILVFMAMPFFFMHSFFSDTPRYPVSARELPEGVTLFLKRVNATGSVLNHPDAGGYLEWELSPRYKIFMDMQVPFLFTEGDFRTIRGAYTDQRMLRDVITRYRPAFITAPIDLKEYKALIAGHPQYRLVFFDDAEVLYADRSQEPSLASQYEIKTIDPFSLYIQSVGSRPDDRLLLKELLRLSELYPYGGVVNAAIATIYQQQGRYREAMPYAESIMRTYPESHLGYKLKADLLSQRGACAEAMPLYNKAIDRSEGAMKELIEAEASAACKGR